MRGRINRGVTVHFGIMFVLISWSSLGAKVFIRVLTKPFHFSLVSVVQYPSYLDKEEDPSWIFVEASYG
jgi:hypothetical protein